MVYITVMNQSITSTHFRVIFLNGWNCVVTMVMNIFRVAKKEAMYVSTMRERERERESESQTLLKLLLPFLHFLNLVPLGSSSHCS